MKEKDMGGECGMYGVWEECMQGFQGRNWRLGSLWRSWDGVNCIYVAKDMDQYCGFVNGSETSGSIKCRNLLIVW